MEELNDPSDWEDVDVSLVVGANDTATCLFKGKLDKEKCRKAVQDTDTLQYSCHPQPQASTPKAIIQIQVRLSCESPTAEPGRCPNTERPQAVHLKACLNPRPCCVTVGAAFSLDDRCLLMLIRAVPS